MALNKVDISLLDDIPAPGAAGKYLSSDGTNWVNADGASLPATGADGNVLTSDGTNWASETPAVDLSALKADILKLAIHQAVEGNRTAYNLEDSFIDGFEDDSGITTETTVDRDTTGEYVSSVYTADTVTTPTSSDWTGDTGSYTLTSGGADSTSGDDSIKSNWTSGTGDFTIQLTVTAYSNQVFGVYPVSEDSSFASNDNAGMNGMTNSWWWQGNSVGEAAKARHAGSSYTFSDSDLIEDGSVVQIKRVSGTISILIDGATRHTYSQTSSADLRFVIAHHGTTNGNVQSMTFTAPSTTTNATGTLISDAQTASSSRTSCSGVIIYEDADGTSTLGTDLEVYFTANNGTNWTEAASYGTATTYSGTKKMVKLGATTVTAGTQVAMKAVWANQVASQTGITDESGTSKTITQAGTSDVTQSTSVVKWGTKSLYFNGGAKLSIAAHSDFDFGTNDATIEFWEYTSSGGNNRVIGRGSHPTEWFYRSQFQQVSEDFKSNIGGSIQQSSAGTRHGGTTSWTHVAIVRDSGYIRVYTGGVQRWSTSISGSWDVTSTSNALGIGSGIDAGTTEWFTGYLQDIRISNTARYPDGTTFTVPSAAFTTDSNTKLLINGNDPAAIGKIARLHGWAVNY